MFILIFHDKSIQSPCSKIIIYLTFCKGQEAGWFSYTLTNVTTIKTQFVKWFISEVSHLKLCFNQEAFREATIFTVTLTGIDDESLYKNDTHIISSPQSCHHVSPQRVEVSPAVRDTPWHRWYSSPVGFPLNLSGACFSFLLLLLLPLVSQCREVISGLLTELQTLSPQRIFAWCVDFTTGFLQAMPPRHPPPPRWCGCAARPSPLLQSLFPARTVCALTLAQRLRAVPNNAQTRLCLVGFTRLQSTWKPSGDII